MRVALFAAVVCASTSLARPAMAGERYYVIIFGSESTPKKLKYTHTWISYVKVVDDGAEPQVYYHTISWLPATLNVRVFAPCPEPGVNLDLYTTLNFVLSSGESVDVWAPIQVSPLLYEASVRQYGRLMRGEALYQAIDPPNDDVYDCIHANAALDPQFGQLHYPLIRVGKPASAFIVQQIGKRGLYFNPYEDTLWILSRLGIDRYPVRIIRHDVRAASACIGH